MRYIINIVFVKSYLACHICFEMFQKLTVFIVAFCLFSYAASGQMEWLNPKPSGYWCNKVIFTSAQNGFIFNSNGDLLNSSDQGDHWNLQQNFPSAVIMDIKDSTGVISGYAGTVYVSRNNGKDWARKNTGYADNFTMADIVSRDTIFLASTTGKIVRSDDGGNTWKPFNCGIQIKSVEFINSKLGYAGGTSTYLLKTQDGGATWQQNIVINRSPSDINVIKFIDSTNGFAFREHSDMLSTTDGGATWKTTYVGDYIYSLFFLNKTTGFACGEHGVTYRTDDAGVTWNPLGFTSRIWLYDLSSIYFLNPDTGFAVGARGRILKTTDGCKTWKTYAPTYIDISSVKFITNSTAYAAIGNSFYKSADSGQSWNLLPPLSGNIYAKTYKYFHFVSEDTGFIPCDNGIIYNTVDGGATWNTQIPKGQSGYDYLNDLQFIDQYTGYADYYWSSASELFKTKDGGNTWRSIWHGNYQGEHFEKIFFVNEKTGYASRYQYLYKTDDSAKTWTQLWNQDYTWITAINFPSAKVGYVVRESGLMKKTADSGKTWTAMNIPSFYDDVYNIKFLDEQTGYLSTEYGRIYKSIDGGNSWTLAMRLPNDIRSIEFGKDSSVYFGGANGTIIKSFVPECRIDSFGVKSLSTCNADFYAVVTAAYSSADSISLQYGTSSFDHEITLVPLKVTNNHLPVTVSLSNLSPSTQYKARIRILYRGQYYYSNEYSFSTLNKPATPALTVAATTICAGDSAVLHSSASNSEWIFNGAAIPNSIGSSYVASQAGKYGVVVKNGCYVSDTASVNILVNPVPPKPSVSIAGAVLSSSASSGNQWYLNGNAIANANGPTYTAPGPGIYTVKVTLNSCASEMSEGANIVFTAVNNVDFNASILLAPNPVHNVLTIRCKDNALLEFSLMDLSGNYIISKRRFSLQYDIDMSWLQAGMYIAEVVNKRTGEKTRRLVSKL